MQAAYNNDTLFWRLSYRGNRGVRHDYYRYTGGAWRGEGGDRRDAQATIDATADQGSTSVRNTIYEQRTSMMFNDPYGGLPGVQQATAPNFDKVGCFMTCHDQARHMPRWHAADGEDGKYIDPALVSGTPAAGAPVLDLWHWRGARSGPIDRSDDMFIGAGPLPSTAGEDTYRSGDAGTAVFRTNSLSGGNPSFVYDPRTTWGAFANTWNNFWTSPLYYIVDPNAELLGSKAPNPITMAYATATARGYVPAEGDVVPRRILQAGAGSRADITAYGTEFFPESADGNLGVWKVQLQRALATSNLDDVNFLPGRTYFVGFEVHLWEYTTRDHYVSFPMSFSVGSDVATPTPDLRAVQIAGSGKSAAPNFDDTATFPIVRLYLFQPGITSWEFLTGQNGARVYVNPPPPAAGGVAVDQVHGGSGVLPITNTPNTGTGCRTCHTVRSDDPGGSAAMSMEVLTSQRGGVFSATPHTAAGTPQYP